LKSGKLLTPYQVEFVGVPWKLKILKIWSISESPINNGFFSTISAKMHPTDQISTGNE